MARLRIITTPELATGYRLAGVSVEVADTPADAAPLLTGLLDAAGRDLVAVHEPHLQALDPALRRRAGESTDPLVVALPAGDAHAGTSTRRAELLRILYQAVGVQMTFPPEEQG